MNRIVRVLLATVLALGLFYGLGAAAPAPSPTMSPGSPPTPAPSPGASPGASAGMATVIMVTINVAQETPAPKPETPRAAGGTGAVVLNEARTEVGYAFTFSGVSGPVMQGHFHRGASGEAGPVVQTICGEPAPALSGACPTGTGGTVAGVWRIPQAMVADLIAGRIYVNFHTATNPGGEIRGQITARP